MSNGKTGGSKRTKGGASAPEVTMTQEQFQTAISEVMSRGAKTAQTSKRANTKGKQIAKDLFRVLNDGVQAKLSVKDAHEACINQALNDDTVSEEVRESRANYLGSPSMAGHKLFTALHNYGRTKAVREEMARMVAEDKIFISGPRSIVQFCEDIRDNVENINTATEVSRADFEDILESLPIGEPVDFVGALFPDEGSDGVNSRSARAFLATRSELRAKAQAWITELDKAEVRVHESSNPKVKSYKALPTMAEYAEALASSS